MKRSLLAFVAGILPAIVLMFSVQTSRAGSATWKANPTSGDWNTAANWTPATVPNFSTDIATFATSNITEVSGSAGVDSVVFSPGASAFVISAIPNGTLAFSGAGVVNNSGVTQNFVARFGPQGNVGHIAFLNSATVGANTILTTEALADSSGGAPAIEFYGSSSAGDGTFITPANPISGSANAGGQIYFLDHSTAGNGTFTINGGSANGAVGGFVSFFSFRGTGGSPTAGTAIFTLNGGTASGATGGSVIFDSQSKADASTLIANGGQNGGGGGLIQFEKHSRGGKARVEIFGNGALDISAQTRGSVTIGSLQGDGDVFLGGNQLLVGQNDLSTVFTGRIQNGGSGGGVGGSLVKIGGGELVLTNANTYTGGTHVLEGQLFVNNTRGGSGTGSGPVVVESGKLGGIGSIGAGVKVGTGTGPGATLAPGGATASVGRLELKRALTFNSDGVYQAQVDRRNVTADAVVANGVTINAGAQFVFGDLGHGTLPPGTAFTIINNISASPIAGKFSNLPDGAIFSSNGNTFRANYTGGNGNDLTLTVQ